MHYQFLLIAALGAAGSVSALTILPGHKVQPTPSIPPRIGIPLSSMVGLPTPSRGPSHNPPKDDHQIKYYRPFRGTPPIDDEYRSPDITPRPRVPIPVNNGKVHDNVARAVDIDDEGEKQNDDASNPSGN